MPMTELSDTYRHKGMRSALVQTLRERNLFSEKVLSAMNKVPRHFFFESAFLEHAYQDKAFSIGEGQTISQPTTVAYQSHLLDVQTGDKVLEIGTGSGYQTSILLELGAKVYSIEYNRVLHNRSRTLLQRMGYNAHFHCGDGTLGLSTFAPYHKIIVTAGAPKIPQALLEQLAPKGMLVIPVGDTGSQVMCKVCKDEAGQVTVYRYDTFAFVPLLGKDGWQG